MRPPRELGREHARAGQAGELDEQEADGAAAEDADAGAQAEVGQVQRVDRNPQRLEHRAVRFRQWSGQGNQAALRPGDPFAEAAVRGGRLP